MTKILIVEDELSIRIPLVEYLKKEGFEILTADTLAEAEKKLSENPSLVLLDWMLPDGQGIELLRNWRQRGLLIPTILLTARTELIDKVVGLELGANDYLTKPFEPRELVARIRVQLRQISGQRVDEKISGAEILLNRTTREGFFQNKLIDLTKTEFELLKIFLENPNQVFSREELLKHVWGYDHSPTTRTVDTHILQLRQKTSAELFETVHGIGYRFKVKSL